MRRLVYGFVIAAFCILSMAWLQPTHAQGQPTAPQISDPKLDAAAKAIKRLQDMQQSYDEKLKKTAPADQDRVISAADAEMKKAVTVVLSGFEDRRKLFDRKPLGPGGSAKTRSAHATIGEIASMPGTYDSPGSRRPHA
jgi:hypothetical protein